MTTQVEPTDARGAGTPAGPSEPHSPGSPTPPRHRSPWLIGLWVATLAALVLGVTISATPGDSYDTVRMAYGMGLMAVPLAVAGVLCSVSVARDANPRPGAIGAVALIVIVAIAIGIGAAVVSATTSASDAGAEASPIPMPLTTVFGPMVMFGEPIALFTLLALLFAASVRGLVRGTSPHLRRGPFVGFLTLTVVVTVIAVLTRMGAGAFDQPGLFSVPPLDQNPLYFRNPFGFGSMWSILDNPTFFVPGVALTAIGVALATGIAVSTRSRPWVVASGLYIVALCFLVLTAQTLPGMIYRSVAVGLDPTSLRWFVGIGGAHALLDLAFGAATAAAPTVIAAIAAARASRKRRPTSPVGAEVGRP